jgi:hypothetical protein
MFPLVNSFAGNPSLRTLCARVGSLGPNLISSNRNQCRPSAWRHAGQDGPALCVIILGGVWSCDWHGASACYGYRSVLSFSVDPGVAMSRVRNWFERTFDGTSHEAAPEVHRIAPYDARIASVTYRYIEYADMAGHPHYIDLEECATCWLQWAHDHRQQFVPLGALAETEAEAACTVGLRGGGSPPFWIEFMNERKTRFEFENWEARCRLLLGPLLAVGWRTFDAE